MSKPDVFIIESLSFEDEEHNRFEGKFLSQILHLSGKKSRYYYVRTTKELKKVLKLFDERDYRYLHISCHGNDTSIYTTLDSIKFQKLGKLLSPHLNEKRLFISTCSAVNSKLAKSVLEGSGCYSLLGPTGDVPFDKAAIIWASFYYLAFKKNSGGMKGKDLRAVLRKIADTFEISLHYYLILNGKLSRIQFNPKSELKKSIDAEKISEGSCVSNP